MKVTEDVKAELYNLHKQGLSTISIGKKLDLHPTTVGRYLYGSDEAILPTKVREKKVTKVGCKVEMKIGQVVTTYDTIQQCADCLGLSGSYITQILNKGGNLPPIHYIKKI